MSYGTTTGQLLIAAAKDEADMTASTFVSDTRWLAYVQAGYQELYDLLIQKFGDDWFTQSTSPKTGYTFTTDGTNDHFSLPADFYHLLGVDLILSGSGTTAVRATLKPFTFSERNRFAYPNMANWLGRTNLRYRLRGPYLWLRPTPASGQTIELWYAPRPADLTGTGTGADIIDCVSGWEEYIIVDAAIRALAKEESDTSALERRKAALVARIESAAENRDAGSPATVADTRWNSSTKWDGSDDGGYGGW